MNIFKNQNGFTLVEIMIGVAMAGGLALTMAKLNENTSKAQSQIQAKSDFDILINQVNSVLTNNEACKSTFFFVNSAAQLTSMQSSAGLNVPGIFNKVNTEIYNLTTKNKLGKATITKIVLSDLNITADSANLKITGSYKMGTDTVVSTKTRTIPMNMDTNDNLVVNCSSAGNGDTGPWEQMSLPALGIYYNAGSGVLIGSGTAQSGSNTDPAFASGNGNIVNGKNSGGLGLTNSVYPNGGWALGSLNVIGNAGDTTSNANSYAIGYENQVQNSFVLAQGRFNQVKAPYGVSIGHYSSIDTAAKSSFSFGTVNYISAANSYALGYDINVTGPSSIGLGHSTNVTGSNAIGISGTASGSSSLAIKGTALGSFSIAILGTASGTSSTAIRGNASGVSALAIGPSIASGTRSMVVSAQGGSQAAGVSSVAIGGAKATGPTSIAIGPGINSTGWTEATGLQSVAIGVGATAAGGKSIALGNTVNANGNNSMAIGHNLTAQVDNSMMIGKSQWGLQASVSPSLITRSFWGSQYSSLTILAGGMQFCLGVAGTCTDPESMFLTGPYGILTVGIGGPASGNASIGVIGMKNNGSNTPAPVTGSDTANFYVKCNDPSGWGGVACAVKTNGRNTWDILSDRRLKTIEGKYHKGLAEILKIKTIRFRYKDNEKMGFSSKRENIGIIAQDIKKLIPESVDGDERKGYLTFTSDAVFWAMVNAVQEQNQQMNTMNEELKKENAALKSRLDAIEERLQALENK
jgi:prepilin-type N-terminal cleavage/methylation domain-containing protein